MNNATTAVFYIGWFFLLVSMVWPRTKWGGETTKLVLNAFSLGLFIAETIYTFVK